MQKKKNKQSIEKKLIKFKLILLFPIWDWTVDLLTLEVSSSSLYRDEPKWTLSETSSANEMPRRLPRDIVWIVLILNCKSETYEKYDRKYYCFVSVGLMKLLWHKILIKFTRFSRYMSPWSCMLNNIILYHIYYFYFPLLYHYFFLL